MRDVVMQPTPLHIIGFDIRAQRPNRLAACYPSSMQSTVYTVP